MMNFQVQNMHPVITMSLICAMVLPRCLLCETCQPSTAIKSNQSVAPYLRNINYTEVTLTLVNTGNTLTLKCCINGNPLPDVSWLKNGKALDYYYNSDSRLSVRDRKQLLYIDNIRLSDAGNYTCRAENMWGNTTHTFCVDVRSWFRSQKPVVVIQPNVWKANISGNITLRCVIYKSVSKPVVSWIYTKNNSITPARGKHLLTKRTSNEWLAELVIVNVTLEDRGVYTCRAQNAAGKGNASQAEGTLNVLSDKVAKTDTAKSPPVLGPDVPVIIGVTGGIAVILVLIGALWYRSKKAIQSSRELNVPINDTTNERYPFLCREAEMHAEDLRERLELLAQPEEGAVDFDVFMSYSSLDRDLVKNTFYPEISSTHQVCIDFKDFEAGLFIQENIANSIFRSRKTLLVITRNFLKGEWTYFEMQIAQGRLMQGHDVLVPVLVDDIPVYELPNTLQHYRQRRTYLEWFNKDVRPHFWDRLRVALGPSIKTLDTP